jgi:hypothetical protein
MQLATSEVPTRHGRTEAAALVREKMGEVACHLEHVAMRAEDHEGAGRRHVFESDAARELVHRQAASRRAADLHRLGVAGATVVEHLRSPQTPNGYS